VTAGSPTLDPGLLARLATTLSHLRGWRRQGLAVLLGLLASLALPPLHWVFALLPAFTGLLWLLEGAERPWRAALIGWSFGFGYFLAGLYWVGIAFLVDAVRHALVMPPAVAGLAAGMALFPALATYGVARTGIGGAGRIFVLAAAWLFSEWLRSWLFTGFPWNLLGSVWTFSPAVLQVAALGGVWALSAMTILAASAPSLWGEAPGRRPVGQRWLLILVLLALPLAAWIGGGLRLAQAPDPVAPDAEAVTLRIVQPAIPQNVKWLRDKRREHVVAQMKLSAGTGLEGVDHVIWAETAVPYFLAVDAELRQTVARIVPPGGYLLTGAPRLSGESETAKLWNSLHALSSEGEIAANYDKFHLVPFGEYMPLREWFSWTKLTAGASDFQAGPGLDTLALKNLPPFSPLICYEAIFPGAVVASKAGGTRPAWLLNITNDAWFGLSSGPYQHFAAAQLRAVEEGLPLVRAANNGISGLVGPYGRVLASLSLDERGYLDIALPSPLPAPPFGLLGNWWVAIILTLLALAAFGLRRVETGKNGAD